MGSGLTAGILLLTGFFAAAAMPRKPKPIPPKEIPEDIEVNQNASEEFVAFFD